jgi:uncharacterized protein with HEPN domain
MSRRDALETLRQLKEFSGEATQLAIGRSRADLVSDLSFRRHAERVIEPIGEACTRLPAEIRDANPEIPWREIIGMRNWLAHGYDGIDYDILWDTISKHAPELSARIGPILERTMPIQKEPEREISDDL